MPPKMYESNGQIFGPLSCWLSVTVSVAVTCKNSSLLAYHFSPNASSWSVFQVFIVQHPPLQSQVSLMGNLININKCLTCRASSFLTILDAGQWLAGSIQFPGPLHSGTAHIVGTEHWWCRESGHLTLTNLIHFSWIFLSLDANTHFFSISRELCNKSIPRFVPATSSLVRNIR